MIPKIIHYCWFGGSELPDLAKNCIESWKKYCPKYEIIEWNENNIDLTACPYIEEAYSQKKWAFVSDFVRLYVLVNYGGIYLDTDVEIIKNLDCFLNQEAFTGLQTIDSISTGLLACQKNDKAFTEILNEYYGRSFINNNGEMNETTNVEYITSYFVKHGMKFMDDLQKVNGVNIYPYDYFCAKTWNTGKLYVTPNTYAIHYFSASWLSLEKQKNLKMKYYCYEHFGIFASLFYKIYFYALHPKNILLKIISKR